MPTLIVHDDFTALLPGTPPELLDDVIEDVTNYALSQVPELDCETLTPLQATQIRSILRVAVKRYIDAGSGAVTYQAAPGGYAQSVDASALRRGGLLYVRELDTIRKILGIVKTTNVGRAIALGAAVAHSPACASFFGGACDCPVGNPWRPW